MLFIILLTGLVTTQRISAWVFATTTMNPEEAHNFTELSNIVCDLPFSCAMFNDLTKWVCECGCEQHCEASHDMTLKLDARTSTYKCSAYTHFIRRPYFVRTKCAPGSSHDLIDDCKAVETFKDVIWVTDSTTREHYRNIACAKCNGVNVNDLLPWILYPTSTCKHYTNEGQQTQGGIGGGIISGKGGFHDHGTETHFGGGFNSGGINTRGSNVGFGGVTGGSVNEVNDRAGFESGRFSTIFAGSNVELVDAGQNGISDGVSGSTPRGFGFGSTTTGFAGSNGELVDDGQSGISDGVTGSTACELGSEPNTGSAGFDRDFSAMDGGLGAGDGFGGEHIDPIAAPGFPSLLAALTAFGDTRSPNSIKLPNQTLEDILNFLDNYTATDCLETFQPPHGFDPMGEYCKSRTIVSSCNASLKGSVGSFDLLKRKCETHETTPMAAGAGGVVYKNGYCFLCNTVNPKDIALFERSKIATGELLRNSTDTITDDGAGSRGSGLGSLDMYIVFIFQSFVMASWYM